MATAPRSHPRPRRRGPGRLAVFAALWVWMAAPLTTALPAGAQEPGPTAEKPVPAGKKVPTAEEVAPQAAAPPVHLDELLKLPDEKSYTMEKRGGLSRGEWRALFQKAKGRLAQEKKGLAAAEAKMDEIARGKNPWKVGPAIPGFTSNNSDAPMDYQLQKEIKERRKVVHALEEQLRQLDIKADLAGVPADWRS